MKRPITCMCSVILTLLIGLAPMQVFASAAASAPPHLHYEECNVLSDKSDIYKGIRTDGSDSQTFQDIKLALPINTKALNVKGMGINFKLWHDKNIVVYGNYTKFSAGMNQFKEGLNVVGVEPYYLKNGKRGEYRYHGYDTLGNLASNMNFKNDVNSAQDLTERRWVYQPWYDGAVLAAPKTGVLKSSHFNDEAINRPNGFTAKWIREGISQFPITGIHTGVTGNGTKMTGATDLFNYVNILSPPTPRFKGSGRMWRLSEDNRILYQTFPVNKYIKEIPLVDGTITVTNADDFKDIIDKTNVDPDWSEEIVVAQVTVVAQLHDEEKLNTDILKATWYNRFDITPETGWAVTLNDGIADLEPTLVSKSSEKNKTTWQYTIPFTKGQLQSKALENMTSTAKVTFIDGTFKGGYPIGKGTATFKEVPIITPNPTPPTVPESIKIQVDLPRPAFDIVPYKPTESTIITGGEILTKELFINGEPADFNSFFSGDYVFGIGQDGDKKIDIIYTSGTGKEYLFTDWIYVYDTKPLAQFNMTGSYKQNRLMKVNNTSPGGNIQLVLDYYPINSYQWSYRGIDTDGTSRRIHDISDMYKELMYKTPGVYEIELIATNTLGRISDPYILRFEIFPDYTPAVDINLNNTAIAREETLSAFNYGAVSTDNDTIATNIIELWYDSNNDGTCDQKLNTYDGKLGFPTFSATNLGNYKYVNIVTEAFGEATMPEYITPADTVSKTVEIEFTVDNYIPMTDIYIDIPIVRPVVDALILLDKNLAGSKSEYVQSHRMDYNNYLRSENIMPTVNNWDMKTYTYSQPASTAINTGGSYPADSTPYSSNGYSGTLARTSVNNAQYSEDHGYSSSRQESKSASASDYQSGTYCVSCGGVPAIRSTTDPYSYSDGEGYSGSLPLSYNYSESYTSSYCPTHKTTKLRDFYRTWYWSGTVYRTVSYWVPNIMYYNNYTGFYNGTIYKSVRQPYINPFTTANSYKYIIYVSDSTVSELADLQNVKSQSDAKLILIGSDAIKSQMPYDYFIINDGRPIDTIMKEALKIITENNPAVPKYTILAGAETFTMNAVTIDTENDPISEQKFLYVQDLNYFDNNTGMNPSAVSGFSTATGWSDTKLNTFGKVGRYEIYTRAKDKPSTDTNFSEFSYYSGTPHIVIYAHRKPFAAATLDWDYNASTNKYKTTWVDMSYDLDHNITMANKGIVDRKVMFRKDGGEWQYFIPYELTYGTYDLKYYVKDVEGVWSDPWIYTFTLANAPTMQFKSDLKSKDIKFGMNSVTMGTTDLSSRVIPSTEWLEEFNLWTRYPYNVNIQSGFWNGSSFITTARQVNYNTGTGNKAGNDITWNNIDYQVPPKRTDNSYLYDGTYTYRISAVGDYGQTFNKDFIVKIQTPINLFPIMPEIVTTGDLAPITATTSKYVSTVSVLLYAGTPYQTTANMTGVLNCDVKNWTLNHLVPANIPTGNYNATFTATAVNGGTEVKTLQYKVDSLRITSVKLSGYWNHWRGQKDLFGNIMTVEPHRFLSYEAVKIDVTTIGNPDKITVEFSPELQAMQFTDKYGNIYDYKKAIGKYITFPLQLDKTSENTATLDYILPLAPSTLSPGNVRLGPAYWMKVIAHKGATSKTYILDGTPGNELIDITGNIFDQVYIQPVDSFNGN